MLFNKFDEASRRAKDGTQTRDPQLGRLMLYQLSYFRKKIKLYIFLVVQSSLMQQLHNPRLYFREFLRHGLRLVLSFLL